LLRGLAGKEGWKEDLSAISLSDERLTRPPPPHRSRHMGKRGSDAARLPLPAIVKAGSPAAILKSWLYHVQVEEEEEHGYT
jgi:hypothetical protein